MHKPLVNMFFLFSDIGFVFIMTFKDFIDTKLYHLHCKDQLLLLYLVLIRNVNKNALPLETI